MIGSLKVNDATTGVHPSQSRGGRVSKQLRFKGNRRIEFSVVKRNMHLKTSDIRLYTEGEEVRRVLEIAKGERERRHIDFFYKPKTVGKLKYRGQQICVCANYACFMTAASEMSFDTLPESLKVCKIAFSTEPKVKKKKTNLNAW